MIRKPRNVLLVRHFPPLRKTWPSPAKPHPFAGAIGKTIMGVQAKFNIGVLLHNRNTNEDGWVERVYEVGGAVMYEVLIPATRFTYNTSDWVESPLELSGKKLQGRAPRH
jgi:hypothetical protein